VETAADCNANVRQVTEKGKSCWQFTQSAARSPKEPGEPCKKGRRSGMFSARTARKTACGPAPRQGKPCRRWQRIASAVLQSANRLQVGRAVPEQGPNVT